MRPFGAERTQRGDPLAAELGLGRDHVLLRQSKMQVSGDFAGQIVRRDEQFSGHILFDEGTESLKLLHSVPDFVDLAVLLRF